MRPQQAAWLHAAGLVDVETVPWIVTSDLDPAGFADLIDGWQPLYLGMARDAGLDDEDHARLRRGFAAHRRAALGGHARWPMRSSFGRKSVG